MAVSACFLILEKSGAAIMTDALPRGTGLIRDSKPENPSGTAEKAFIAADAISPDESRIVIFLLIDL